MGLTLVFEGCSSLEGKRGESPPLVLAGRPTPEESTLQASGFFPQAAAHLRPFPLHTTSSAQNFILTQTLVTPPSPSYERSPRTVAFHSTLSSRPLTHSGCSGPEAFSFPLPAFVPHRTSCLVKGGATSQAGPFWWPRSIHSRSESGPQSWSVCLPRNQGTIQSASCSQPTHCDLT
jgi:hypothetical protein